MVCNCPPVSEHRGWAACGDARAAFGSKRAWKARAAKVCLRILEIKATNLLPTGRCVRR